MREIVFDTETTGLNPSADRIIEIGGIELENRFPTGRKFHYYINPGGVPIHPDAQAVHGIRIEDLIGKPVFAEIMDEFLAFVDGAHLVAHNAGFDLGFVNAELNRHNCPAIAPDRVVDTLVLARRKHPMGPNSLDALCRRYAIDHSRRTLHGALLDAELLAEVYIELVGGRQAALILEVGAPEMRETGANEVMPVLPSSRPAPLASRFKDSDLHAHRALIERIGEDAIWRKILPPIDRAQG